MKIGNKWVLAALLALASSSLSAAPLVGQFNITGNVTVSGAVVDWQSNGGTTGLFTTESPASGSFVGLFCGNPPHCTGVAKDLFPPPGPVLSFLSGFTAPGFGGLFFDMSGVLAPSAPPCSTVSNPGMNVDCSLGQFTLKNTASGVQIDFGVAGFFQNGADLTSRSAGVGLYTTQMAGKTVLGVTQNIVGGGSESASYSANFITAIPEPGTAAMLGIGAIAMFLGRMRSKRRSNS